jgi:hypothetical protein
MRVPIPPSNILTTSYPGVALIEYRAKTDDEIDLAIDDQLRVFKRYNYWSYVSRFATCYGGDFLIKVRLSKRTVANAAGHHRGSLAKPPAAPNPQLRVTILLITKLLAPLRMRLSSLLRPILPMALTNFHHSPMHSPPQDPDPRLGCKHIHIIFNHSDLFISLFMYIYGPDLGYDAVKMLPSLNDTHTHYNAYKDGIDTKRVTSQECTL